MILKGTKRPSTNTKGTKSGHANNDANALIVQDAITQIWYSGQVVLRILLNTK